MVLTPLRLSPPRHHLSPPLAQVAFETVVLGVLRPGYRCLQMRSARFGTRIRLTALLVHVQIGDESSDFAQVPWPF